MFQFTSGSVLGRYELLVPVARGGMAEVWAARLHGSRGFTKLVAIKTIRTGSMDDTRLEQMLLAEAQLASQIQHANVVSTLELGEQDETLFLVMEWADAEPLSFLIKETVETTGVPLRIAVNIIAQACRGVHSAHELADADGNALGVVHRDISPQNVLVTYQGVVKLVDFGIAKATQRASSMTEDGEVKGKLAYMSPEQVKGQPVDRRTDIFALGTMLYMLTTGQHPFKGTHPGETLAKLCSPAKVAAPSTVEPDYPKALEQVVMTALEKRREARFETALQMMTALEEAVPESRGIDAEVAGFLSSVSGSRRDQRRRHIRTAGELLDHGQELSVLGQTATSLSALSVATAGSSSVPNLSQTLRHQATGEGMSPRSVPRWALAGGAAMVLFAGVFVSFNVASSDPEPGFSAGAADLVPQPSYVAAEANSVVQQRGTVAVPKSTDAGAPANPDETRAAHAAERTSQRKLPVVKEVRRRGAKPALSAEAIPLPAEPEPRKAPKADSRTKKIDSWDPNTYGGRL